MEINPLSYSPVFLPWLSRWNIDIYAIPISQNSKQLSFPPIIEDVMADLKVLNSGESIKGSIDLNKLFPNFKDTNEKYPIALYHEYTTKYLTNKDIRNFEGCLFLEKQDK